MFKIKRQKAAWNAERVRRTLLRPSTDGLRTGAVGLLERVAGIEPTSYPWEGYILPLYYTRTVSLFEPILNSFPKTFGCCGFWHWRRRDKNNQLFSKLDKIKFFSNLILFNRVQ